MAPPGTKGEIIISESSRQKASGKNREVVETCDEITFMT